MVSTGSVASAFDTSPIFALKHKKSSLDYFAYKYKENNTTAYRPKGLMQLCVLYLCIFEVFLSKTQTL